MSQSAKLGKETNEGKRFSALRRANTSTLPSVRFRATLKLNRRQMFCYPSHNELKGFFNRRRLARFLFWLLLALTGCSTGGNDNSPPPFEQPVTVPGPAPLQSPPVQPAPQQLQPAPQQLQSALSAPPPVATPPAPQAEEDKRAVIAPSLAAALHMVRIQAAKGAEGFLKIQVDVENRSDAPQSFRYAIEWLNANGDVLPLAGNGFLDWMLRAHETSTIAVTAPTAAAKDFRIVFISPS